MKTDNSLKKSEQVNVSLEVVWKGAAERFDARMREISLEGCFIEGAGNEQIGETIKLNVSLPSGIWITLHGKVVDHDSLGFEVRFENLTPEHQGLLTHVVAAHGGKLAQQIIKEGVERVASVQSTANTRRFLIADDDAMTLAVITAIIETQGDEAVCASDGREACRILQTDTNFSAAIFDMMMPHLDGLGLIHYMKSDDRLCHIPIGMITADQDPKIWDDSVAAGASVFLAKPFTPPQFQMMLRLLDQLSESQQSKMAAH